MNHWVYLKKFNIAVDYYNQIGTNSYETPLWRVLSTRGYLCDSRYYTKDKKKEILTEEGYNIVPCGANNRSIMVEDYKSHLFDFNMI